MPSTERRIRRTDIPVPKVAGGSTVPPGGSSPPAGPGIPIPGAPQNLRVVSGPFVIFSAVTPQAGINLAWSAPTGTAPDSYLVQWSTDALFTNPVGREAARGQLTMGLDGLPVGTANISLWFRVAAKTGGVLGAWSNVVSATVTPDTTAPGIPLSTSAAFDVTGTLEVRATPPASANFKHIRVEIWNAGNTVQIDVSQFAGGVWSWSPARNRQQTAAAGLGVVSTSVTVRLYAVSWGGASSSVVTIAAASAAPTAPTGLAHTWTSDPGTFGPDLIVTHTVVNGLSYVLGIDTVPSTGSIERLITAGRYAYAYGQNAQEHAGVAKPALALALFAENGLGQRSPAATATATNAAPPATTLTVVPAVDRAGLTITPSAALDLKDYRIRVYLNGGGTPVETFFVTDTRYLYQATAGSGSYQFDVSPRDLFGQVGTASALTTAQPLTDWVTFVSDLREDVTYTDSIGSTPTALAVLKDETTGSGGITYALSASAWRWTLADRKFKDRHRHTTVSLSTATPCYLGTSPDGTTWTYHYGGTVTGGVWTPTTTTTTEATAQAGAVSLNGVVSIRLGSTVEARFIRLGHRNTGASYALREFYPRSLVTGDDILSQSITSQNLAVGAVVAGTVAVGALDGFIITGGILQTATSGARTTMDATGFHTYDTGGLERVRINSDGLKTFNAAGVVQIEATTATNGALKAGAGKVTLDNTGFFFDGTDGNADEAAVTWKSGGTTFARIRGGAFSGGNSIIIEPTFSASLGGATVVLRAGGFSESPTGVDIFNQTGLRRVDIWTDLARATGYLRVAPTAVTIANAGLNVGAITGAAAGTLQAGQNGDNHYVVIGGGGASGKSSLAMLYDASNDRAQIVSHLNGSLYKPLYIHTSVIGINTFPVVGETMRIRGGGGGTSYTLVTQDSSGFSTFGVRDDGMVYVRNFLDIQAAAAPATGGGARIYLDSADGDLKVKFPNGVVRTLVVN